MDESVREYLIECLVENYLMLKVEGTHLTVDEYVSPQMEEIQPELRRRLVNATN